MNNEPLSEDAIAGIESLHVKATALIDNDTEANIAALISHIPALCQTVRALRAELAEAQQLAETRSDIIAAKAAHVDQLQSRLAGHGTSSLLRRLKDFLFENCNHGDRDRNYDWCPSCVMAFMDVVAQPSDTELKERLAQVEKERDDLRTCDVCERRATDRTCRLHGRRL